MRRLVGIPCIAIAVGCSSRTVPNESPQPDQRWASLGRRCSADAPAPSLRVGARDSLPPRSLESDPDARWAALAGRVPGGWGGFFLENGVPTIYLIDPARKDAAIAVLTTEGLPVTSSTRVKQGRWDFAQLYHWYRYLLPRIRGEGLTTGDIQETRNRLEFGVIDEAARARVEQALARLGVPCFLVAIEIRRRAVGS